jgi:hypothetical protein
MLIRCFTVLLENDMPGYTGQMRNGPRGDNKVGPHHRHLTKHFLCHN